jgi:hypothetical protein
LADHVFSLEGAEQALWDWSAGIYRAVQVDQGIPQDRFWLKMDQGVYVLSKDGLECCRTECRERFFQQVEWVLTMAALDALDNYLQIHAGVVSIEGNGWLLSGAPDAGKTTLSLALALNGAELFSDEIALLDVSGLKLWPFRRDMTVHRGTWVFFAAELEMLPQASYRDFGEFAYIPPHLISTVSKMPVELSRLVFPAWQLAAPLAIQPLGPAETARRLLGQAINLEPWGAAGIEAVAAMVSGAPAIEVVFGDAREAATYLLRLTH